MPFDALQKLDVRLSLLGRLGIVPLRKSVVAEHKSDYVANFCRSPKNYSLYESGIARWVMTDVGTQANCVRLLKRYSAPREVRDLVRHISRDAPNARYAIEWFYEDPILYINEDRVWQPLAIWDNKKLVALAKDVSVPTWADRIRAGLKRFMR